jgi:hypothetical protein
MKARFALVTALLALAASALSADPDVEKLLSNMREAYKSVKTAQLTVKQTQFLEDEKAELEAVVSYKNPEKIRMTATIGPKEIVLRSNGKKIRIDGAQDAPVVEDVDMERFPIPFNLETICFWDYQRQLSTDEKANMHESELVIKTDEEWNDKKWTVLEETVRGEQKVFVRYFIDPKTNLIWRTVVADLDDKDKPVQDNVVLKMETGVELEDKLFEVEEGL